MNHSQWTSYLSSVLSASEMAGFLTAELHAWLLLEEKGTILNQNSTLRTSLHNICIKDSLQADNRFITPQNIIQMSFREANRAYGRMSCIHSAAQTLAYCT